MDRVRKPNISESDTPSSESYSNRLRVFEYRVLRRIFGQTMDEVTEVGENCIMRGFITYILSQV
jgi:hypothetical protein